MAVSETRTLLKHTLRLFREDILFKSANVAHSKLIKTLFLFFGIMIISKKQKKVGDGFKKIKKKNPPKLNLP